MFWSQLDAWLRSPIDGQAVALMSPSAREAHEVLSSDQIPSYNLPAIPADIPYPQ